MRNFISCAIASVLFIAATGVRAQVPGVAVGAGDGGVLGGVGAEGAGVPATLSMDTDAEQPLSTTFTVNFRFSKSVSDFALNDIRVTNGTLGDRLRGTGRLYTVEVTPKSDFDGLVNVEVRSNAVDDGNPETDTDFEVDTRAPRFVDATIDEVTLVITYDEDLDRTSEPETTDYTVRVENSVGVFLLRADVRGDEVTLILRDPVSKGDRVTLDYVPPTSNPLQDELGNEAVELDREPVTNNTLTGEDLPSKPRNLRATADGRTRIDLDWDAPSDDGGFDIIGYRIESSRTGSSGSWDDLVDDTESTRTTYTDTGLDAGTRWFYRVSAINREGEGPPSDIADATTDGGVPSAVRNLTATENGQLRIDLSWDEPSYDGGGISGYLIEVSTNRGSAWSDLEVNTRSTSTTYSHTGLTGGTTRHYRVSAISSAGTGDASNVASATTDIGPPSAPVSLSAVALSESRIQLSWGPPTNDGGARITGYRIDESRTGGTVWTTLVGNTRSTSMTYTHGDLPPGTTRTYRVAAINSQGTGVYSRRASATTRATVPSAPTSLTASASGQTRINLSWRAPLLDGGARITGYRIEFSPTGTSAWTVLVPNTSSFSTTYTHRGLAPATTRYYRVFAINSVGHSEASNIANAKTDATVPGAPTRLSAAARGQNQIDLSWVAPASDGGAPITGYRIESSTNGTTFTTLRSNTNSPATTFPHTGLAPATRLFYRVYAINSAGRSPASNIANATTDATVPTAPTSLSATASGTSQIDLSWQAPSFDGGARISGYRIDVADSGGGPWAALVANTRSGSTSYSHTGLAPASTRYYRVSAINSVGRSPESGVANATTDATVPDAPTNLMATATEPTRIDLVWAAPAYDGGAPVSSYRIEISVDGAAWSDLAASTGVTSTAYGHTGLKPGSTRHYRVSAINVAGTGVPSNVASATTDDPRDRAGRVNREVLSHAAAAMTSSTFSAIAGRVESFADSDPFGRRVQMGGFSSLGAASALQSGMSGLGNRGFGGTDLDARRLLDGASFLIPLGGDSPSQIGSGMPALATWGSGQYHNMSRPRGGLVDWEGNMLSLHAGADVRLRPHVLAGLVATRSTGDFDFTDKTGETDVAGTYASRMTSINPYVAGFLGRVDITGWATGGYGWGSIEIEDERKELRSSKVSILNGGAGGVGDLLASGNAALRLKAEGWLARVDVEGAEEIDSVTLDMGRARVALEWKQGYRFASGHEMAVLLEGGLRYDSGDGPTGSGMEFGGGLRYVSPQGGLTLEGRGRLLATGHLGYEEWGVSGLVQFDTHGRGEGLSVRMVPTWGEASSGVQALWDRGVSGMPHGGFTPARGRLNTEVEYGLRNFAGTPYGRFYIVDGGDRAFGSGVRYEITRVMDLRLEGTRRQSAIGTARHGLTMRGLWKF
ncbi:MAG: fibronectin type III domain-containing protein [Gemmatimonadetes bacterium]|nr:fibronectin type III domain-containing protein [Gemmatimonadota bacterium]